MDKYQKAIMEYESRRKEIVHLSTFIGTSVWFDEETGDSGFNCENLSAEKETCIERYWNANKAAWSASESTGETVTPEKVALCPSCTFLDDLIQKRKSEKRMFGIAKRRLSAMGKALLKADSKD